MKYIWKRLFLALPGLIVLYVGTKDSFGQPPKSLLMELLDAPTPDSIEVKKILGDHLSNKWLLYVNYSGTGAREVEIKFFAPGAATPLIQKTWPLPFLDIFETVPVNQNIEFEVRLTGGTKIKYPIYTPKCGSANGCLTLIRLGTGPAGFSEQTIQFPPPKRPNWLVRQRIPLLVKDRKFSLLTAFFGTSTVGTYVWNRQENKAVKNHYEDYNIAFRPEVVVARRIDTEKAMDRRKTAKYVSITSGVIFGALLLHDYFGSKPQIRPAPIEEEPPGGFGQKIHLKLQQDFSDQSISLGICLSF